MVIVFCFKQKTAYEMRISDWSSDVCSSDLRKFGKHRCCNPAKRSVLLTWALIERGRTGRFCREGRQMLIECTGSCERWPRTLGSNSAMRRKRLRSVVRAGGEDSVSTCRSRWSTYQYNRKSD